MKLWLDYSQMCLLQDMRMPLYMPDQADVAPRLSGRCSITCTQHRMVLVRDHFGGVPLTSKARQAMRISSALRDMMPSNVFRAKFASFGIALASSYRTSRDWRLGGRARDAWL